LAPSDLGVSAKTMSTLFPPELLAWAATPDDAVTVQAWLHWLHSKPAAVQSQLANRRQSTISHAVERVLLAQYKQLYLLNLLQQFVCAAWHAISAEALRVLQHFCPRCPVFTVIAVWRVTCTESLCDAGLICADLILVGCA
jgi:hypothetical protein